MPTLEFSVYMDNVMKTVFVARCIYYQGY